MGDIKAQFKAMGEKYQWEKVTVDWMTAPEGLAATSMNDFLEITADPSKFDDIVKMIKPATGAYNLLQQASRLRQAWKSLKDAETAAENLKKRGLDDTDLDSLLHQDQLDELADAFHRRYKVTFPPTVAPGDVLVSRISKELDKRLMTPKDVWKTKTQAQQQRAVRKKQRVADNVEILTHEQEVEDDEPGQGIVVYMAKLFTLLIAYSMAGVRKRLGGTPPEEKRTTKSVVYVHCPLDVLFRYFFRVQDRAHRLPSSMALEWIQERDEAEREMWIDKFRNSSQTLGEVIHETFQQREAMWEVQKTSTGTSPIKAPPPPPKPHGGGNGGGGGGNGGGGGGTRGDGKNDDKKTQGAKKIAKQLRDKTKLCTKFQQGKCDKCKPGQVCNEGKHACGGVMKSGRVCGGPHPACKCTNKAVPR